MLYMFFICYMLHFPITSLLEIWSSSLMVNTLPHILSFEYILWCHLKQWRFDPGGGFQHVEQGLTVSRWSWYGSQCTDWAVIYRWQGVNDKGAAVRTQTSKTEWLKLLLIYVLLLIQYMSQPPSNGFYFALHFHFFDGYTVFGSHLNMYCIFLQIR